MDVIWAIRRRSAIGKLLLAAVVLAVVVGAAAHAVPASGATFNQVSGASITSGDLTETNRPLRDGTASTCAAPKASNSTLGGTYHYDSYTQTNQMNNSACVSLTLSTTCASNPNMVFAQTYDPSFDPANISNNYLADAGASPTGSPVTYSYTVSAGHTFVDVVNETTQNGGCSSYGLKWESNVPWDLVRPQVSGSAQEGQTLTTSPGTWNENSGFTYQWRRCASDGSACADIGGATEDAYTLTSGDVGHRVLARVATGASSADSGPSPVVVAASAPTPPPTTTPPTTTPTTTTTTTTLPPAALRATISGLSETHSVFRVGLKSTPLLGRTTRTFPRGTTFSFRLSQPATVTLRIQRKLPGRRVGRVCKPPSPLLRFRPRCTRLVTKATLRRTARVGLNRIAFSGRIRGHALPAGFYRAAFTAANSAGTSALRALSFRIVAP